MYKKFLFIAEKFIFRLLLAGIFPFFLFLFFWWFGYFFNLENYIQILSMGGLILGILTDVFILKTWINKYFSLTYSLFTAVYVFYSLVVFVFFLGVPVFNLIPAVLGGYYYGRKMAEQNSKTAQIIKAKRKISLFTTFIMFLICFLTVVLILLGSQNKDSFKTIYNLNITHEIINVLIISAGILLTVINYFLTNLMFNFGLKIEN